MSPFQPENRHAPTALPSPVTAFAPDQECELVSYHAPGPVVVEHHHAKPVFLQERLYGTTRYGPSLWVCGNCHDAIHAWLYHLLGERVQPPHIGYAAKAEAERTYLWYTSEQRRILADLAPPF